MTETTWPTKTKILTIWSFTEDFWTLVYDEYLGMGLMGHIVRYASSSGLDCGFYIVVLLPQWDFKSVF